jgi:hypothetical protein
MIYNHLSLFLVADFTDLENTLKLQSADLPC